MPSYAVVPATLDHAAVLAVSMREADAQEAWAACRFRPLEALTISVLASRDPKAGVVDGRVACMFGVAIPSLLGMARPWLLGSNELPRHSRIFLRRSRAYVEGLKVEFPYMGNYVDARNTESIRWLRWLGFNIYRPAPFIQA